MYIIYIRYTRFPYFTETLKLLVSFGCDTTLKSTKGRTALDMARSQGQIIVVVYLKQLASKGRHSIDIGDPNLTLLRSISFKDTKV